MIIGPDALWEAGLNESLYDKRRDERSNGELVKDFRQAKVPIERRARHDFTGSSHTSEGCKPLASEVAVTAADLAYDVRGFRQDRPFHGRS